jgi:hypothetical protein
MILMSKKMTSQKKLGEIKSVPYQTPIPAPLFCRSVSAAVASATVSAVAAVATTASSAITAAIATAGVIFVCRLSLPPPPTAVSTTTDLRGRGRG